MKQSRIILLLVFVLSFVACNRNSLKVDISAVDKEIEVVPFGDKLFNIQNQDTLIVLGNLHNKYPDFFNLFTYRIIRIGGMGDEQFLQMMKLFLTDTMVVDAKAETDEKFEDFSDIEKGLKKAFKYYNYHFPEKELPTIYTYVSGFNQSVVTAGNIIGISLDKYLGRDCEYYRELSTTPSYKIFNMHEGRILPDVAYAWGITEFENNVPESNLLANMIQKGKIMYLVDAMLPDVEDSLKIGYSSKQLKWCYNNELAMWTYLIERKMLYTTKRMNIVRYINDSPTTSGFPLDSPGRTGIWIGWQIVRQYMKKHPEITLPELMKNKDYQMILNESEYDPG